MGDFEESARRVSGGEVGSVSRENQLQLYAYYSVATKGGAPARGPSPYLDPRGGAKWQAWDAASHLSR
jgi:acyl-CoA-binding protein